MNDLLNTWRYRNHIIGLEIYSHGFRMIELKAVLKGVKCINLIEKSFSMDTLNISELLNLVVSEYKLQHKRIILQMPHVFFRHYFIRVPNHDGRSSLEWLEQNWSKYLPPGLTKIQIQARYQIFTNASNSSLGLITLVRQEMLDKWIDSFRNLNLWVAGLYGNPLPMVTACAFLDKNFYKEKYAFIHSNEETLTIIISDKGNIIQFQEFYRDLSDLNSLFKKMDIDYNTLHRIILTGHIDRFNSTVIKSEKVQYGDQQDKGKSLLTLGLALEGIYPCWESLNLLPDIYIEENQNKIKKIQLIHWTLRLIIIFIAIYCALQILNISVTQKFNTWQQKMKSVESQMLQIQKLKEERNRLTTELMTGEAIITQRVSLARILFDISKIMPSGVWLRKLTYGKDEATQADSSIAVFFEGLALNEFGPVQLLSELEQLSWCHQVQLESMQSIPANEVFRKSKLKKIPLIKFKIVIQT